MFLEIFSGFVPEVSFVESKVVIRVVVVCAFGDGVVVGFTLLELFFGFFVDKVTGVPQEAFKGIWWWFSLWVHY